jgi:hypothetical protein
MVSWGSPSEQLASLALVSVHFLTLSNSWSYGFDMVSWSSPSGQLASLTLVSVHLDTHPTE